MNDPMNVPTHSSELLKGTIQTIILKLLADHSRMYGYEITQKVKEISSDSIQLTEGSLYPTLHRLEAEGLLKTEIVKVGKRVRKYYTLTKSGRKEAGFRVDEFTAFVKTMTVLLKLRPI
jgi:PadR family transcriptional regulator PadR